MITAEATTNSIIAHRSFLAAISRWHAFERLLGKSLRWLPDSKITFLFDANDLDDSLTYLVSSNHQSMLDPFVELAAFAPDVYRKLGPIRSMTLNRYFRGGLTRYAALHMGCFPAKAHDNLPSGLEFAKELLSQGQTVFICPEGRRTLPGEYPARSGVAVLADLPNVQIIPAHIQWKRHGRFRRSFHLTMGKPFDAHGLSAQEILDRSYDLSL